MILALEVVVQTADGLNVAALSLGGANSKSRRGVNGLLALLKLGDRPALLLGMNAIRAFDRVSIDFANRKFRVVLPETGGLTQAMLASR